MSKWRCTVYRWTTSTPIKIHFRDSPTLHARTHTHTF
jgi:hypothetical protein